MSAAALPARRRVTVRVVLAHGWRFVHRVLAVIGLGAIIYFLCFDLSFMVTPSMAPTLASSGNPDWVLTEKVSYWFREPRRWEVVQFDHPMGFVVMKRVVGLPGERVALRSGQPVINGTPLPPPARLSFLHYFDFGTIMSIRPYQCTTGYFVLGDDSKDSQDSRYEGELKPDRVTGRVWARVWPLSRVGWVSP